MNSKSQAALEFLTTYVWAFLVIVITIGTLYYFGIFDFSKYLPQKCTFPSQFECLDFSLKPNEVRIKLVNNIGENIRVTSLQIKDDAATPLSCASTIPATPFDWTYATEKIITFTSCAGSAYISGSRVELKITLGYFALSTPSNPIHVVNGKIEGTVGAG